MDVSIFDGVCRVRDLLEPHFQPKDLSVIEKNIEEKGVWSLLTIFGMEKFQGDYHGDKVYLNEDISWYIVRLGLAMERGTVGLPEYNHFTKPFAYDGSNDKDRQYFGFMLLINYIVTMVSLGHGKVVNMVQNKVNFQNDLLRCSEILKAINNPIDLFDYGKFASNVECITDSDIIITDKLLDLLAMGLINGYKPIYQKREVQDDEDVWEDDDTGISEEFIQSVEFVGKKCCRTCMLQRRMAKCNRIKNIDICDCWRPDKVEYIEIDLDAMQEDGIDSSECIKYDYIQQDNDEIKNFLDEADMKIKVDPSFEFDESICSDTGVPFMDKYDEREFNGLAFVNLREFYPIPARTMRLREFLWGTKRVSLVTRPFSRDINAGAVSPEVLVKLPGEKIYPKCYVHQQEHWCRGNRQVVLYREDKLSIFLGIRELSQKELEVSQKVAENDIEVVLPRIRMFMRRSKICDHVLLNVIKVSSERFLINRVMESFVMLLGGRWQGRVIRVLWGDYDPVNEIYVDHYGIKFKVKELNDLIYVFQHASAQ